MVVKLLPESRTNEMLIDIYGEYWHLLKYRSYVKKLDEAGYLIQSRDESVTKWVTERELQR